MSGDLQKWIEERNRGLAALDMEYARKMLPGASSDFMLLLAMHKARYECTDLSDDLRHESAKWLREGGWSRMTGGPLLPDGELPG